MALPPKNEIISKILEEKRSATREELEELFQRTVLKAEVPPRVLQYFSDNELRRAVSLELFYINCIQRRRDYFITTQIISDAMGYYQKKFRRRLTLFYGSEELSRLKK